MPKAPFEKFDVQPVGGGILCVVIEPQPKDGADIWAIGRYISDAIREKMDREGKANGPN